MGNCCSTESKTQDQNSNGNEMKLGSKHNNNNNNNNNPTSPTQKSSPQGASGSPNSNENNNNNQKPNSERMSHTNSTNSNNDAATGSPSHPNRRGNNNNNNNNNNHREHPQQIVVNSADAPATAHTWATPQTPQLPPHDYSATATSLLATASSVVHPDRRNLRVVSVNILFERFYSKYTKTDSVYPAPDRAAAFRTMIDEEPMVSADVICFQEFDRQFVAPLVKAGFMYFQGANPRGGNDTAYVATAMRKQTMTHPYEQVTVPLDNDGGSKALFLLLTHHRPSGRLFVIGNAHVPWHPSSLDAHKYCRVMSHIMLNAPNDCASIVSGDFNTDTATFEQSLNGDEPTLLKNAIGDIPFTSLSPSNDKLTIDHMWYYGGGVVSKKLREEQGQQQEQQQQGVAASNNDDGSYLKRATVAGSSSDEGSRNNNNVNGNDDDIDERNNKREPKPRVTPLSFAPSHIDDFVRHSSTPGKPNHGFYFSDHATIGADFEVAVATPFPEFGALLAIAKKAEMQFLNRDQPFSTGL